MALRLAEIIFNDSNSQTNKDLTDFLKRNLEAIITKGNLKLKLTIAGVKDHANLRQRGIKPLPALLIGNDRPVCTVPNIIERLRSVVKSSRKTAAPKSEEEVLGDYFSKTLGNIKQNDEGRIVLPDDGDDEVNNDDLVGKLHQEMARRGHATMEVDPTQGKSKKKQQADRQPPPKPRRDVERDFDEEDMRPQIMQTPGHMPRHDNVGDSGDPMAALNKISGKGGGDAALDDQMMTALLAKMSDGE